MGSETQLFFVKAKEFINFIKSSSVSEYFKRFHVKNVDLKYANKLAQTLMSYANMKTQSLALYKVSDTKDVVGATEKVKIYSRM